MLLESNDIVYADGRHNGFPCLTEWRGRFWLAFRSGISHASPDGRILVISSPDLRSWSEPSVVINSSIDDRDPHFAAFQGRLFVAAPSVSRRYGEPTQNGGSIHTLEMYTTMSATDDGLTWQSPWRVAREPYHCIWWLATHGEHLYATEAMMKFVVEDHRQVVEAQSSFLRSGDGHAWERIAVISRQRLAHETALAFLPDGRAVGFVRHEEDLRPEFMVSRPPYTSWESVVNVGFKCAAPGLGIVGDTIVAAGRAYLDDPSMPLTTPAMAPLQRGLVVMTVDLERADVAPGLLIPHTTGPMKAGDAGAHRYAGLNGTDVAMPSVMALDDEHFAIAYYEGYMGGPAHIRLARLRVR